MGKESTGGKNWVGIFRLKNGETAYTFLDKLTTQEATTPSPSNAAWIGLLNSQSKPQFQADGTIKYSLTQYDSGEEFYGALDTLTAVGEAVGSVDQVYLEDSVSLFGTSSSADDVLLVSILHANDMKNPTKYFVVCAVGSVSATSGSFETAKGKGNSPTFEFEGKLASFELTIPATLFPSTILTGAEKKIKKGACYNRSFIAKAA